MQPDCIFQLHPHAGFQEGPGSLGGSRCEMERWKGSEDHRAALPFTMSTYGALTISGNTIPSLGLTTSQLLPELDYESST